MKIGKLKQVADLVLDPGESSTVFPQIALEHVVSWEGRLDQSATLQEVAGGSPGIARVSSGDILFGKLRPYLAKSFLVERDAYASTELLALRAKTGIEPRWLGYVAISRPFVDWAVANSHGSKMPRTSWQAVREFEFAIPNSVRQRAIADFLDAETAQIDAISKKKSDLLTLLAEKSVVTAHSLVTDKDDLGGRREAGWLGDVPDSWEVVHLSRVARIHMGTSFPHDFQGQSAGELPFVKVADLGRIDERGTLLPPQNWITREVAGRLRARVLPANCILYARVGAALLLNPRARAPWPCVVDDNVRGLGFKVGDPTYWLQVLRLLDLKEVANPGIVPSVSERQVAALRVPLPPLQTQLQIADKMSLIESELGGIQRRLNEQILCLRERRQALITAAVTGQIDIPGVAA